MKKTFLFLFLLALSIYSQNLLACDGQAVAVQEAQTKAERSYGPCDLLRKPRRYKGEFLRVEAYEAWSIVFTCQRSERIAYEVLLQLDRDENCYAEPALEVTNPDTFPRLGTGN